MLRKLLVILGICAAVTVGSSSLVFADFQDGFAAYQRGDYTTALKELKPLAEQGNSLAQYSVGQMYYEGKGVSHDYSEAVKWYRLAAKQGFTIAQHNLGWSYQNGHGVSQDYAEAVKWYRLAAEQGYPNAQHNLGVMYR